jgi:hypothetical protein
MSGPARKKPVPHKATNRKPPPAKNKKLRAEKPK